VPSDFAWGVATAAYQIEGAAAMDGKGPSIWDDFCKLNGTIKNNQTGDVADDFYHKYKGDIALMKSMGIKHFRMSLSWSRILPNGTTDKGINGLGVAFYNYVINEMLAAGITPWVTLHHWDTPSALHNRTDTGSFLGTDIIGAFDNYADLVFSVYGDRVKHWITFNEPWTYSLNGYCSGDLAPGRCSDEKCKYTGNGGNSSTEPYIVAHHMMLAHGRAARTYKNKYQQSQGGVIGFTTNTDFNLPYDVTKQADHDAASRAMAFSFAWFVDPVIFGKYPDEMTSLLTDGRLPTFTPEESAMLKGSVDYIGLNHYTSSFTMDDPNSKGGIWWTDSRTSSTKTGIDGKLIGPQAAPTWLYVYPQGLRGILGWVNKRYDNPIIYVFENGVSVPHENDIPITEALHDNFRIDFYKGYIQSAIDAITTDGVDLRGYFAWSLMDNFEWAEGYSMRFGMTYVDYPNNQKRYAKDSLYWYSMFTRTGNINGTYTSLNALELMTHKYQFLE
jgi:beta-glucosidase